MTTRLSHLEILTEEESMRAALGHLLPRIVPGVTFQIRSLNSKNNLKKRLPGLLAGYAHWPAEMDFGVVVVVDRDDDDCATLRSWLDSVAMNAGFSVASVSSRAHGSILNRIAIEELEAWFFGDVDALTSAYPRVPRSLGERAGFRDADGIDGAWEKLEKVLMSKGYHQGGLSKVPAAQAIAQHMDVEHNRSVSFCRFRDGVRWIACLDAKDT